MCFAKQDDDETAGSQHVLGVVLDWTATNDSSSLGDLTVIPVILTCFDWPLVIPLAVEPASGDILLGGQIVATRAGGLSERLLTDAASDLCTVVAGPRSLDLLMDAANDSDTVATSGIGGAHPGGQVVGDPPVGLLEFLLTDAASDSNTVAVGPGGGDALPGGHIVGTPTGLLDCILTDSGILTGTAIIGALLEFLLTDAAIDSDTVPVDSALALALRFRSESSVCA